MKLEKRSSGGEGDMPPVQEEKPAKSKPVVVYIMILFIAAFLLMALSFLMHQRSNTEAFGQLQNSVSAMQEVQANQEKIIELQEELNDAQKADEIFTILMGDEVDPRREFIEQNAKFVKNLDI